MLTGVEAELAFGWTRIAGEWVHARMQQGGVREPATLIMVEGAQTLTPRCYLAGRLRTIDAPNPLARTAGALRARSTTGEVTVGYRVSPDLTLRTAYQLVRSFKDAGFAHRAGVAAVWARRWF